VPYLLGLAALQICLQSLVALVKPLLLPMPLLKRLSDAAVGRLRRPTRRLRRLIFSPGHKQRPGKFALGNPIPRYSSCFLTALWGFNPRKPPMPLTVRRKRMFKSSINSHAARLIFDRGRSARHLI